MLQKTEASPALSTGVFMVRLWLDEQAPNGMRARISRTADSTAAIQVDTATSDPEELYSMLRLFVEAFIVSEKHRI